MKKSIIWYVADPMCSWCWGFAPVIEQIQQRYADQVTFQLLPGGLRAGTTQPFAAEKRAQILQHWHAVHAKTGQPFTFEQALPADFIYDTEPACRAVASVSRLMPAKAFAYFAAIQHAFYVEQADVTQHAVLQQLAEKLAIPTSEFTARFQSDEIKGLTQDGFQRAVQWGVSGFPTLIAEDATGRHPITAGYRPFADLRLSLDAWLQRVG